MADAPHISPHLSAEDENCLSPAEMRAYHQGQLKGPGLHRVERHLLTCDLCAMAYEDFSPADAEAIEAGAAAISAAAWQRATEKKSRRMAVVWMSAAAGVALLITAGYFLLRGPSDQDMQAVYAEMMDESLRQDTNIQPLDSLRFAQEKVPQPAPAASGPAWAITEDLQDQPPSPKDADQLPQHADRIDAPQPDAMVFDDENVDEGPGMEDAVGGSLSSDKKVEITTATRPMPHPEKNNAISRVVSAAKEPVAKPMAGASRKDDAKGSAKESVKGYAGGEMKDKRAEGKAKSLVQPNAAPQSPATETQATVADNMTRDAKEERQRSLAESEVGADDFRAVHMDSVESPGKVAATAAPAVTASSFDAGMAAYGRKDFTQSATLLRAAAATTPDHLEAHLYAGISFLNIQQPQAAIYHLDRVLAVPGSPLREDAEWYKALAHLQMKEAVAAKSSLKAIESRKGKHSVAAKKALQKLD